MAASSTDEDEDSWPAVPSATAVAWLRSTFPLCAPAASDAFSAGISFASADDVAPADAASASDAASDSAASFSFSTASF